GSSCLRPRTPRRSRSALCPSVRGYARCWKCGVLMRTVRSSALTYVLRNTVGEQILGTNEAWLATCQRAGISGLRFHDLRREFACRLLETRAELHDVRDFLGHASITTTSRYLRSSSVPLANALERLEALHDGTSRTSVAHSDDTAKDASSDESAELLDP